jgi:hypothetical protein
MIDFIIGATLMNAMPHLVLGIWKGRMFSLFGFGNTQNIAYGFLCLCISVILYLYQYGLEELFTNKLYLGALCILLIYVISGRFWQKRFTK